MNDQTETASTGTRTQEEIIERYKAIQETDFLGFRAEVLLGYLHAERVRPFLKPDADLSDWDADPSDRDSVLKRMREYMEFAWEKAIGERGISASRSVQKMEEWLWMLGDDELFAFSGDGANYAPYGKPVLAAICRKYGFPIPDGA